MAQALSHQGLDYEIHYFAQSDAHLAFGPVLESIADSLTTHLGLSPQQTGVALDEIVGDRQPASHLYVCGPGPMLGAARETAAAAGWPDDAVHFEYFSNTAEIDLSSTFELSLARSALTFTVEAGQTVLHALRVHGVAVPSSCEQGACGTCMVTVLEGEPDHQDVYLNESERRAGDRMLTCVSRARSSRLVLDS